MDPVRFDHLTRLLGRVGGRRAVLGALLGGLLGPSAAEAIAPKRDKREERDKNRGNDQDNRPGKGGDRNDGQTQERLQAERQGKGGKRREKKRKRPGNDGGAPPNPPSANCCGTRSCAPPEPGSTRSQCDFAGQSFVGQDHNGSTVRGIDGRGATFTATDNQGSIFAEACLQGARFRRARLDGSTWGDACLFGADFTGADFGSDLTLFDNALFCDTVMPDGSVNDRDCGQATACCRSNPQPGPACQSAADCPDEECQTKACQNGLCAYQTVIDGPSPNTQCAGQCCEGVCCDPGATECNQVGLCCAPNCAGKQCGPDGCGGDGTCGTCPDGEECDDGVCVPIVCTGTCSRNSDCPDAANCVCDEDEGECCTRNCTVSPQFPKVCGSDGCGGSCGTCPDGTVCNLTGSACICTPDSCPDGCCDFNSRCRPNSDAACGVDGAFCQPCGPGTECDFGACVCTPRSCPDGCCDAETGACVSPPTGAQCGVAGTACRRCPGSLNECLEPVCSAAGVCGIGNVPDSSPCVDGTLGEDGICCQGFCTVNDPANCERCNVPCPPPANRCQVAVCNDSVCGAANGPDNVPCATANGAGVCCDGTCCDACCNGVCCDRPCCGETCCGPGQSCCNGVCCDQPCCGGVCCGPNQPCCNGVCCCGFGDGGRACCGDDEPSCCELCDPVIEICCANGSCAYPSGGVCDVDNDCCSEDCVNGSCR